MLLRGIRQWEQVCTAHGVQINFGDLTLCLTYGRRSWCYFTGDCGCQTSSEFIFLPVHHKGANGLQHTEKTILNWTKKLRPISKNVKNQVYIAKVFKYICSTLYGPLYSREPVLFMFVSCIIQFRRWTKLWLSVPDFPWSSSCDNFTEGKSKLLFIKRSILCSGWHRGS